MIEETDATGFEFDTCTVYKQTSKQHNCEILGDPTSILLISLLSCLASIQREQGLKQGSLLQLKRLEVT